MQKRKPQTVTLSNADRFLLRMLALNGPDYPRHLAQEHSLSTSNVSDRLDGLQTLGLLTSTIVWLPPRRLYHLTVPGLAFYINLHEHDFIADYHRVLSHWKHLLHIYDHWFIADNQLHLIAQARTCVTTYPFNDTRTHDLYASL